MTITKMDANGRVLLPLDIRFKLDLNSGDKLAIDQLGDGTIIIKKPEIRLGLKGDGHFKNYRAGRHPKDISHR
jgi:AbrB family looped-hinge helix DNA binding protein